MQVYSIPDAMRQTLIPTLVMVMFATCSTLADVRVEPSFGHPYVFGDRIVFTSVDRTHLIAIDKKGRLQWEMAFPAPIFEQRSDEEFLVQSERHVYKVDVANGTKSQVFVMPENEVLIAGFAKNFLAAADHRFDHNHLRIINPPDFWTAWESSSIESIIAVTPSTVIAVSAERKYEHKETSYHLENGALRGFDRKSGEIRWSIRLTDGSTGELVSAQVGSFIAVVEPLRRYDPQTGAKRLVILNPDTGVVLSKRDGNFTDLWPLEDSLGVLERSNGAAEAEFYVCKLPECAKESPISLVTKEILRGRLYADYIITAGIYDSACFERATGKRLWEKGQLEWSEPFDDEMIVTDFSLRDRTARIVGIDLGTGQEHVLFSRTVTDHDKASFSPW